MAIRVTIETFPCIHEAFATIRSDGGCCPSDCEDHTPEIPLRWELELPAIEAALKRVADAGQLEDFCIGDEEDMKAIKGSDQALINAHAFLNDFFDGWAIDDEE